jgi:hypothetical protein
MSFPFQSKSVGDNVVTAFFQKLEMAVIARFPLHQSLTISQKSVTVNIEYKNSAKLKQENTRIFRDNRSHVPKQYKQHAD